MRLFTWHLDHKSATSKASRQFLQLLARSKDPESAELLRPSYASGQAMLASLRALMAQLGHHLHTLVAAWAYVQILARRGFRQ